MRGRKCVPWKWLNNKHFPEVRRLGDKRKVKRMVTAMCRKLKTVMKKVLVVVRVR